MNYLYFHVCSLKVIRKTPAIVVTLRATVIDDEEDKEAIASEQPLLTVDVASCSSTMEKSPEQAKSTFVADSVTSPVKSTTSKRTKKSKSSRKST